MKRIVGACIAIAIFGSGGVSVGDDRESQTTVEVCGVRVVKPPPEGNGELRAFWTEPGTSVALLAVEPNGKLVMFDSDHSRLAAFVDDKGKDLTKPEKGAEIELGRDVNWAFPPQPTLSKDHKHCIVEVSVPGVPMKQATALTVRGTLVLKVATGRKEFVAQKRHPQGRHRDQRVCCAPHDRVHRRVEVG